MAQMTLCPTCHQPVPLLVLGLTLDPVLGLVTRAGYDTTIHLQPTKVKILAALLKRNGKFTCRETLWDILYGDRPDADQPTSDKSLDVQILRLRRQLAPLDLVIANAWTHGWRLESRPRSA